MKQLINWKLYDTEKSTMLLTFNNNCEFNEPDYSTETLFKTKNWKYFICWTWKWSPCYLSNYSIWVLSAKKCISWFERTQEYLTEEGKEIFFNEFVEYIEKV